MDPALVKLLIFVGLFLVFLPLTYWRLRAAQDPEWEDRWQELPLRERERIARGVRRGEHFEDPDEAYLAAGSARYQRSFGTGVLPHSSGSVVLLGIVLIASIAAGSLPMIAVSLLFLAIFGGLAYRARVIQRNLDRAEDLHPRD